MNSKWLNVGIIVNTHGIRGDLKVLPKTDFPDERFKKGSKLMIFHDESGQSEQIEIEAAREQKGMFVIKLKGYSNINDVERYKGWVIRINAVDQGQLNEGEYFYHQIIGCDVVTDEGEQLGKVTDILSPGANDVWVVQSASTGKEILLPVIDPVIKKVDVDARLITVHLIEGLI